MTSQQKTETNWPNLWLEQIARNQQMNGQLQVESLRYEELIDDWLEFTVLEAGQRGPALTSRLVGCTDKYKRPLNRESLRAEDGVNFFRDTVRPYFIKVAQGVSFWRFFQFTRARRKNIEMVKWIGKF